jgi:hypothetical protein
MKGTGSKTGNAYDMAKLVIVAPVEIVNSAKMQKSGYGYQTHELDLEPQALAKLNFHFPPEGLELDLIVGSEVRYGKLQAVITGATKVVPAAAVKSVA